MINIILSLGGIGLLLLATEILWKTMKLHAETARKIMHISSGIFIAFWPLWLSWSEIVALCLLMFAVVFVSRKFKIFNSIHGVRRLTKGELLYPLGIALTALIAPSTVFFWIAVLNLAVADGLAAVAGNKLGFFNGYSILGHKKSVIGTLTFFVASSLIFSVGMYNSAYLETFPVIQAVILFPLLVTAIENISWYGLDNLTIPMTVVILLGSI